MLLFLTNSPKPSKYLVSGIIEISFSGLSSDKNSLELYTVPLNSKVSDSLISL